MRYLLILIGLLVGEVIAQVPPASQARVESLENSPARKRLNEIQQYRPPVRRSRSVAVRELQEQIAVGKIQLQRGAKSIEEQEQKMEAKKEDAWTGDQLVAAQEALEELEAYLEEAEAQLAIALVEEEKVQTFFAREKAAGRVASPKSSDDDPVDEDEEDVDEEDDDGDEEASTAPANRSRDRNRAGNPPATTHPDQAEPVTDEPDIDEDEEDIDD